MVPACKLTWLALALLVTHLTAARADDVTRTQCRRFKGYVAEDVIFSRVRVTLYLERCNLTLITSTGLAGLTNVTHVAMARNEIESLDPSVFNALPKTVFLSISYNQFTSIPVFGESSVLPELVVIEAGHNNITKLDNPKTFSSTKELRILRLENNQIGFIHSDMFSGLKKLERLYLQYNKLTSIDDKTFAVESLRYVLLGHNLIENMAVGAFRGSRLVGLHLDDNKLTRLPEDMFTGPTARLLNFCYEQNPWQAEELNKLIARKHEGDARCSVIH